MVKTDVVGLVCVIICRGLVSSVRTVREMETRAATGVLGGGMSTSTSAFSTSFSSSSRIGRRWVPGRGKRGCGNKMMVVSASSSSSWSEDVEDDDDDDRGRLGMSRETSDVVYTRRGLFRGASACALTTAATLGTPREAEAFIDLPSRLHNRYFFVRHGESVLDVRGEILSNPSFKYDATFGLTRTGRIQMQEAAKRIMNEYDGAPAWLYTSNFQRSFQSALVLREEIGLLFSQMRTEFSGLLDPRKMGALDFGPQTAWDDVWSNDLNDPTSTPPPVPSSLQPSASVESCQDLYRRALEAFTRLEATYYGEDIIIVSHQDTLSVFAAALNGTDLSRHHLDYPFALGEVRCIDLTRVPEGGAFSPTDLRGDYAVGDSAINYS